MPFGRWASDTVHAGLVIALMAAAGCSGRTDVSLEQLLREPMSGNQHALIARQYRERATEAGRIAATHEAMEASYRASAAANDEVAQEMVEHCRALARDYADAAARYEALADNHAALAAAWRDAPGGVAPDEAGP